MIIELQKLIDEYKARSEKAHAEYLHYSKYGVDNEYRIFYENWKAFSEFVHKLTLLLNTEKEKQQ